MFWSVTIIEGDDYVLLGSPLGVEHNLALTLVNHHRFLCHNLDAPIQGVRNVIAMEGIHRGNHQEVGFDLIAHPIKIGKGWTCHTQNLPCCFDSLWIDVTKPNELQQVRVILDQWLAPHSGGAITGADDRITSLSRTRRSARGLI